MTQLARLANGILLLSILILTGSYACADERNAGMVLDLHGSAQLQDKDKTVGLQLLAYLKPGMQISLPAGSKASLSLYATRTVYQLSGPALVEIARDKLVLLQGTPPLARPIAEKLVTAAQASDDVPGAYRLRRTAPKLLLTRPENQALLLNTRPRFCWSSRETATFAITLQELPESAGHSVVQAATGDNCWQLPEGRQLAYGKTYRWTVSYTSAADKRSYSAEAEFSLPAEAEAAQFAALKPSADAAIEEWILYAATMRNQQLNEEAHSAWQFIATRRPDLDKVQELAK
jgi:hypothetical protein